MIPRPNEVLSTRNVIKQEDKYMAYYHMNKIYQNKLFITFDRLFCPLNFISSNNRSLAHIEQSKYNRERRKLHIHKQEDRNDKHKNDTQQLVDCQQQVASVTRLPTLYYFITDKDKRWTLILALRFSMLHIFLFMF